MPKDETIKPSAVVKVSEAFATITDQMLKMGLTERDLILLIQDRAKGNINRTDIKNVLDAIRVIEKQFLKKQEGK